MKQPFLKFLPSEKVVAGEWSKVNGEMLAIFKNNNRPCAAKNSLPIADCRLPIADCRLPIADCRLPIADCRFTIDHSPLTTHH